MLVREFLEKSKTVIMPFFFPKLKTKLTEDKRKIETEAVGDTKKIISEMFRGLEKTLT